MAKKRMTDTEIWDKEWFMDLSPKHKCLIKYLFDKCDASGVWKPNWKLASLHIGEDVSMTDLKALPSDQYEVLQGGKIFFPDFINFQYGKLSKSSPAHKPIFRAIENNNLSNRVFNRVSDTLQEKEEEKEEETEKEIKGGTGGNELQAGIVHDLKKDFKEKFPNYLDEEKDMPALLSIAYKIAGQLHISKHDALNGKAGLVRKKWAEYIDLIAADKWYSAKSLSFINNDFTQVNQLFNSPKNGTHQQHSSTSSKHAGVNQLLNSIEQKLPSGRT